jgi:hypothetical protein
MLHIVSLWTLNVHAAISLERKSSPSPPESAFLLKHRDYTHTAAFLSVAILGIVRPVVIVGWAKHAHPGLMEDDEAALWIARLVGIGGLGVVIFFCVIIIRSF